MPLESLQWFESRLARSAKIKFSAAGGGFDFWGVRLRNHSARILFFVKLSGVRRE
ncbi:MAG: hypothetical protein WCV72_02650 [Patescibacteria group bacterium]